MESPGGTCPPKGRQGEVAPPRVAVLWCVAASFDPGRFVILERVIWFSFACIAQALAFGIAACSALAGNAIFFLFVCLWLRMAFLTGTSLGAPVNEFSGGWQQMLGSGRVSRP